MMENAVYSVISPEGCARILWKDSSKVADAAECLKLTSHDLYKMNVIEKIIREPKTADSGRLYESLGNLIYETFQEAKKLPVEQLLERRYQRFRKFGAGN